MKKLLLIGCLATGFAATSQTTLFSDDLESGNGNWTFSGTGDNAWRIDNVYWGGGFISDTPNQPGGVTNGPQSTYMHITSNLGCSFLSACNANFDTGSASDQKSTLNTVLNTTGQSGVTFEFYYLCGGAVGTSYGQLEYSTNGGSTWTQGQVYSGVTNWTLSTVSLPAWDNQADLRFRFRWVNGGAGIDPAFAVDEINITASAGAANTVATTSNIVPAQWCEGSATSIPVDFTSTGTFTAGNVYTAQLSDAAGSFASPLTIGTLNSTANSGTIAATVPGIVAAGSGYRIRVISSAPATVGSDNGSNLTISPAPTVTLGSFAQVCVYDPFFTLTGGAPASGTYSGTGVTANVFDPSVAGVGTALITYTYTDGATGCSGSAQSTIVVDACAGIEENTSENLIIYPNPADDAFAIEMEGSIEEVRILELNGRLAKRFDAQSSYTISEIPSGVYFVKVTNNGENYIKRLVIQ